MRPEHSPRILPFVLALLLAACGASATPTPQRGAAVAAATNRPLTVPTSRAVETATLLPSAPPSRTVGTPTVSPPCAATSASYPRFDSVAALAWASQQIIAGVVTRQLAPIAVPLDPQDPASARIIYTDYVVRVDRQLRDFPAATVIVRRQGGTLDGCTYENPHEPSFAVGDGVLLFLREFMMPNAPAPAYVTIGGQQGHWKLKPDGAVVPSLPTAYPEAAGALIEDIAALVRAALSSPPPKSVPPNLVVPLDQAPPPAATPTLATPGRAVVNQDSLIAGLRSKGLTVEQVGSAQQPFLRVEGIRLRLSGAGLAQPAEFQLHQYGSVSEAIADRSRIGPDGDAQWIEPDGTGKGVTLLWVKPPHFYHRDYLIVIYVGTDQQMLALLEEQLGKQFAGR